MASIQDLMSSIAQMEGFNTSGTIANRNNNPGNLRYSPLQIGQEDTVNGKFATFASAQDGWAALQSYIEGRANTGVSLRDFTYTYAPPSENDTSNYLNYLTSMLGVGADSKLSEVINGGSVDTSVGGNSDSFSGDSLYSEGIGSIVGFGVGMLLVWLVFRGMK